MLKGINKKIVVVKNTGSDFFEEAIFIIKAEEKLPKEAHSVDLATEARMIIDRYKTASTRAQARSNVAVKQKTVLWEKIIYSLGALSVLGLLGLVGYVLMFL